MAENPFWRFWRRLTVPMSFRDWERMPRLPSYKNEYWDDAAQYTARPKSAACYLPLDRWGGPPEAEPEERWADAAREPDPVLVRPLEDTDWPELARAFAGAFRDQPPISQWRGGAADRLARVLMNWSRDGKDGPLVRPACHVALIGRKWSHEPGDPLDLVIGATLVNLTPTRYLWGLPESLGEPDPNGGDRPVLPHLTWIFAGGLQRRQGLGTLLLDATARALRGLGHRNLASNVLLERADSTAFHWRNGFVLPPHPSFNAMKRYAAAPRGGERAA